MLKRRRNIEQLKEYRVPVAAWDDVQRTALEVLHVEFLAEYRNEEQRQSFRCKAADMLSTLGCYWLDPDSYAEELKNGKIEPEV